jgi:hypothetical protein
VDPSGFCEEATGAGSCLTDKDNSLNTIQSQQSFDLSMFVPYQGSNAEEACPIVAPRSNSEFNKYTGDSEVFHCGYEGYVGKYKAVDGMHPECFYDHGGYLVDENHENSECRGTPDEFNAKNDAFLHATQDSGGIFDFKKIIITSPFKSPLGMAKDVIDNIVDSVTDVAVDGFVKSAKVKSDWASNMDKINKQKAGTYHSDYIKQHTCEIPY